MLLELLNGDVPVGSQRNCLATNEADIKCDGHYAINVLDTGELWYAGASGQRVICYRLLTAGVSSYVGLRGLRMEDMGCSCCYLFAARRRKATLSCWKALLLGEPGLRSDMRCLVSGHLKCAVAGTGSHQEASQDLTPPHPRPNRQPVKPVT